MATLFRNFASYAAALAGYTAAIIASDQLGATGGPNGDAFMLAVTRVALMNVVGRAAPFQRTVAPATKLLPSTVRVKAGPPAVALAGMSVVTIGRGAPVDVSRSRAGATWIIGFVTVPPGRLSLTGRPVACRAETRSVTDALGAAWRRTAT